MTTPDCTELFELCDELIDCADGKDYWDSDDLPLYVVIALKKALAKARGEL